MKRQLSLFSMLFLIMHLAISCNKDRTDTLDITRHKWKVKSVILGNETFKPTERKNSYVLEFQNDSTFSLDLSVNSGGGKYAIPSMGVINIKYAHFTEKCCENEFDKKLLEVFPQVTTYKVIGNTLIFKGAVGEIEFKKKW